MRGEFPSYRAAETRSMSRRVHNPKGARMMDIWQPGGDRGVRVGATLMHTININNNVEFLSYVVDQVCRAGRSRTASNVGAWLPSQASWAWRLAIANLTSSSHLLAAAVDNTAVACTAGHRPGGPPQGAKQTPGSDVSQWADNTEVTASDLHLAVSGVLPRAMQQSWRRRRTATSTGTWFA